MKEHNFRYNITIVKNLSELERTFSYRNGVNESLRVAPTTCWSFFSYAYLAMYDVMFLHAIKILDQHKDAASFWYLWRCNQKQVEKYLLKNNLSFTDVKLLSEKLIIIRDKTHFHIDKKEIFHPDKVWNQADITGDFFNMVIDNLWNTLKDIFLEQFGKEFLSQVYQGRDIEPIIRAAKEKGITV